MNFFENSLVDLINLEEKLDRLAADAHDGNLEAAELTDVDLELRDIIEEFRKHHEQLVYQDHLINKLAEVQL